MSIQNILKVKLAPNKNFGLNYTFKSWKHLNTHQPPLDNTLVTTHNDYLTAAYQLARTHQQHAALNNNIFYLLRFILKVRSLQGR